jgi:hypothetical protein
MRRQGNGHAQHADRKRQVINHQLIAIEEGQKERNLRLTHRVVEKIKEGYKLHTVQCKDMKGNIIDDKEQIRRRWKEHFEETLNENKTATIHIQQNQMNTEGEVGIQAPTERETHFTMQKLNNSKSPGIDSIPAELLKHG